MKNNKLFRFLKEHPIKVYLIFISFIAGYFLFSLHQPYDFLYPIEQVTAIQLISIPNEVDLYQYPVSEIPSMLDDRQTRPFNLDKTNHSAFLCDFADIPFHKWFNDPCPKIQGKTIRITYSNGSREWICAKGTFYQDVPNAECSMTWYYFDAAPLETLLSTYGY